VFSGAVLSYAVLSLRCLLVLVLAAAVTVLIAVLFSPAEPVLARYFEATWHSFTARF
jgi:hypothetical protein